MQERDIEKRLVTGVRYIGGVAYKFSSPGRRGVPDRAVLLPGGKIVFVELKSPGKRLSRLQDAEIRRLQGMGFVVEVVDSMEGVDTLIRELKGARDGQE